jgi:hypothetical protein
MGTAGPGRLTKRQALQAVFDLSLDSAVELDRLRLPAAKRLAHGALALAEEFMSGNGAVAALPASLVAQVLYEEGYLDDAERMIGGRLPAITASGMIEGAIRLWRYRPHRRQPHLASMVLYEAEELGERRNWPRLVCTSIAGRLELLLQHQQIDDAEECAERLEGLALRRQTSDSLARAEMQRLAALGRCRVALARRQTRSAIANLRLARDDTASGADLHRSFHQRCGRMGRCESAPRGMAGPRDRQHDIQSRRRHRSGGLHSQRGAAVRKRLAETLPEGHSLRVTFESRGSLSVI